MFTEVGQQAKILLQAMDISDLSPEMKTRYCRRADIPVEKVAN